MSDLWGGRFNEPLAEEMRRFSSSYSFVHSFVFIINRSNFLPLSSCRQSSDKEAAARVCLNSVLSIWMTAFSSSSKVDHPLRGNR